MTKPGRGGFNTSILLYVIISHFLEYCQFYRLSGRFLFYFPFFCTERVFAAVVFLRTKEKVLKFNDFSTILGAPNQYNPNLFPIGDGFGLFVFFDRYETTHFRNGVKKQPTSKPRGPQKKKQTP